MIEKMRKVSITIGSSVEIGGIWYKISVTETAEAHPDEETPSEGEDLSDLVLSRALISLNKAAEEVSALANK